MNLTFSSAYISPDIPGKITYVDNNFIFILYSMLIFVWQTGEWKVLSTSIIDSVDLHIPLFVYKAQHKLDRKINISVQKVW